MKTLDTACLGKLPTHGDFVSHRASTPTMRAFDEWVRKGLHQAKKYHRDEWEKVYDQGSEIRFFFWGYGQQSLNALLGVFRPSRDRGGRTYPFMVTCEVPKRSIKVRHLSYLFLQTDTFYAEADRIVEQALETDNSHKDIIEEVEKIDLKINFETSCVKEYKKYLKETTVESFFENLFGHFGSSKKYRLFNNVIKITNQLKGKSNLNLNYGIKFPLYKSDGNYIKCITLWVEMLTHLLGGPEQIKPTLFWSSKDTKNNSAFMILYLGHLNPKNFFYLINPRENFDLVYTITDDNGQSGAEAALSIPKKYGRMIEDKSVSLWELLGSFK